MKPVFEPSAQDFLDAQRNDPEFRTILNHIFDEVNALAGDPTIDGVDKLPFPVPYQPATVYRICWGRPVLGRSFWYTYEGNNEEVILRVYNIGLSGVETPFLSRR